MSIQETCFSLRYEIIVIDGGSFDECGKMIKSEFPSVQFIQSLENVGFGQANNLAAQKASASLLLFLNPDTVVKENAVDRLFAYYNSVECPGILGAKLLNSDGSLQTSCVRKLPTPFNRAVDSNIFRKLFPRSSLWGTWTAFNSKEPVAVEAVSGACMLLAAETFKKVCGFTPDFFMYGEDMDLCAKVRRIGLLNYFVPTAEIIHHGGGASSQQPSHLSTVMMRAAGETYMRLNHGRFTAFVYRFLQGVSAVLRLLLLLPGIILGVFKSAQNTRNAAVKWWWILRWAAGLDTAPITKKNAE
jgi:GT2 family glycosyltransferase